MSDGITIDVSNQDYDIDVILEGVVFFTSGMGQGQGFVQVSGTPVAAQIPVFTAPAIIRGYTNFTYSGSVLAAPIVDTPQLKVDHIAEHVLGHGIVFDHQIHSDDAKNIGTFSSGFAGQGWKLVYTGGLASLTVDNLTVRRKMAVYELEIREINHVGGSLLLSVADGKVESFTGNGPYNLYFDTNNGADPIMFEIGDFVRAQVWTGSGIDLFEGSVTDVQADYITVSSTGDPPWIGMKLCQVGHPTDFDRQNMIYLTAADDDNPYISGLAGVTDGIFAGHEVFRLGNLTGIDDVDFGVLSGYGLYANNVYLKGHLQITGGLADLDPTAAAKLAGIADYATVGAAWGTNLSNIPATLATPAGNGLYLSATHMGYYSSGTWKTYTDNAGNFILGDIGGGGTGISWNQGTAILNIKGAINITNTIPSGSISGLAAIATSGSWANLSNIPAPLSAPSGAGLYISSTFMGYYDGGQWKSYIDDSGNCVFQGVGQFGTITGTRGGITISENMMWENTKNETSYIEVNTKGYSGGLTQYRGFIVSDGKGFGPGHNLLYISPYSGGQSITMGDIGYTENTLVFEVFGSAKIYKNLQTFGNFTATAGNISLGQSTGETTIAGSVCIGTGGGPSSYACLDLSNGRRQSGAKGALIIPNMTTAERDALTGASGMMIYNTTTSRFNIYFNSWMVMDWS